MSAPIRIGVVSDTHSLLRPEVIERLAGVEHIVHGGDVGSPDVLTVLEKVAPLTAVRGNNDKGPWARDLPETARLEVGGVVLYVLHDLSDLDLDPRAAGIAAVIFGHSHKPEMKVRDEVLYFNPGSIGPRRFRLPISMGTLSIERGIVSGRLTALG
jgi:putative phosphoesterase